MSGQTILVTLTSRDIQNLAHAVVFIRKTVFQMEIAQFNHEEAIFSTESSIECPIKYIIMA